MPRPEPSRAPRRCYLPEIHDIHPGTRAAAETLLAHLPVAARGVVAWMVVPRWRDRHDWRSDPAASAWLRDRRGTLVQHGYAHTAGERWLDAVWYGTPDEAEFRQVTAAQARDRSHRGQCDLDAVLDPAPRWFCAPRWAQAPAVAGVLRDLGFAGWMTRDALVPASGLPRRLPAVWFDEGRRPWTKTIARGWRRGRLRRLLASGASFRLVLHPRDLEDSRVREEIAALIRHLDGNGWTPLPLDAFV